ncbi:RluA family pseudouridine synthase [Ahrensia sp. 13_GOM-1096m]|uniref:RluA family pseudouridine synthase n=1 Tax=Ahrensia sp. 13_GOM-1096m TaxID=1380380 RepID=UPI0004791FD5|nr:RluA family pseudouridine synthase [Ahrensia sp. 13_GOM-1096m]
MEEFIAEDIHNGLRLDQWLSAVTHEDISRNRIKAIIEDGHVQLNGETIKQPKKKIAVGDKALFVVPEAGDPDPVAEDIPLDVLYEDEDLIVIDKPAGLVVHPGAGNLNGTLVNALIYHCGDTLSGIGGVKRPGIVHRLDKQTSGVMVVAKNDFTHRHLSSQFADHGRTGAMRRVYTAIIWGAPQQQKLRIENFLGRGDGDRTKQAVVNEKRPGARNAVTHVQVIERYGPNDGTDQVASLVNCELETGRTHQIRVHMAHIGYPLIGDDVYGAGFRTKANILPEPAQSAANKFRRQSLHARLLAFKHPKTGEILTLESEPPQDMQEVMKAFSNSWN